MNSAAPRGLATGVLSGIRHTCVGWLTPSGMGTYAWLRAKERAKTSDAPDTTPIEVEKT